MESRRLYIGGISDSVLESDIKSKFGEFGKVKSVEIRCKENFGSKRYFAYIDIEAEPKTVERCVRQCDNLEWMGGHLKVQPAKESFLQKAQKELFERRSHPANRFAADTKAAQGDRAIRPTPKDEEESMDIEHTGRSGKRWAGDDSCKAQDVQGNWPGQNRSEDGGPSVRESGRFRRGGYQEDQSSGAERVSNRPWERNDGKRPLDRRNEFQASEAGDRRGRGPAAGHERTQAHMRRKQGHHWSTETSAEFAGVQSASLGDRNGADAFEVERNDLFEGIDDADDLGAIDEDDDGEEDLQLLDAGSNKDVGGKGSDQAGKAAEEGENDLISENNLKELFDGKESQSFALSSLFADHLKVVEDTAVSSSDDEDDGYGLGSKGDGRSPRKMRVKQRQTSVGSADNDDGGENYRFGDEFWRRAEHADRSNQKSWAEMRQRPPQSADLMNEGNFFILPGDKRLNEGLDAFRTDADPSQFIDAWAEQAEQLALRLFQRKTNTRTQQQMAQRLSIAQRLAHKKQNPKAKGRKNEHRRIATARGFH